MIILSLKLKLMKGELNATQEFLYGRKQNI